MDGVGGNVNRLVRQKMLSQAGTIVQSAQDFFEVASDVVKTTKIMYIHISVSNFYANKH